MFVLFACLLLGYWRVVLLLGLVGYGFVGSIVILLFALRLCFCFGGLLCFSIGCLVLLVLIVLRYLLLLDMICFLIIDLCFLCFEFIFADCWFCVLCSCLVFFGWVFRFALIC